MAFDSLFGGPDTSAAQSAMQGGVKAVKKGAKQAYGFLDTGVTEAAPNLTQAVNTFAPYNESGNAATTALNNFWGNNGDASQMAALNNIYNTDPYQFLLNAGDQGVLRNRAALGGVASGNSLQALSDYNRAFAYDKILQPYISGQQFLAGQGLEGARGMASGLTSLADLYNTRGQNKANVATGAASNIAGLKNQYGSNVTAANTASDQMWAGILSGLLGAGAKVAGGYFG